MYKSFTTKFSSSLKSKKNCIKKNLYLKSPSEFLVHIKTIQKLYFLVNNILYEDRKIIVERQKKL